MRPIRFWFPLMLATLFAAEASATIVPAFPLRQLAMEAHEVVRGQVVDQRFVYDPARDRIYTHTRIVVDEDLRWSGPGLRDVVVRQLGGVVGDRESHVVGNARLKLGAEVVLFARTDGTYHYVVGMSQGAYEVMRSPDGSAVLTRGASPITQMIRPGPVAASAPDRMSLQDLRDLMASLKGRRP
ncbi:MAG: hypothetical protein VX938_08325 [Myxococcota bacterium]|nr:hypothetical protein [Myxococcota bacterium]